MSGEHLNIVSECHGYRAPPRDPNGFATDGRLPGLVITMRNGEVWFHPYTGNRGAPWRMTTEEDGKAVAAYDQGHSHGNRHDHPYDPHCAYSDGEKDAYRRGFSAGRDVWIAGKPTRALENR
ncbi:MAG: hypothetical protein O9972_39680 [Burkholderiales bacterium]|nr:hypothetical protein [Burkholderiales bacterium]